MQETKHPARGGTFRQNVKRYDALRPKTGGGYAKPYFVDAFKPTNEPGEIDRIRVIPGDYNVLLGFADGTVEEQKSQYFPYVEHFHGTQKKGCICSGGPLHFTKDKREPYFACDQYWHDRMTLTKGQSGPWSKRDLNAFTILHYAPYALVEQLDQATGKPRTNTEGKAYQKWVQVKKHQRLLPEFQGKEMRDAHLLHWSLGGDHWKVLIEYDRVVGDSCKSCGGVKTIKSVAWTCTHCGEALIESETTTLSVQEYEELTTKPVTCAFCNYVGCLNEIIECSGCNNPVRAEIFDVDLEVRRIPNRDGGNRTQLMIVGASAPRPIAAPFGDLAKPMDFAKIFTPTPYEKQTEIFGGGVPRHPVTAAAPRPPYGATRTLNPSK